MIRLRVVPELKKIIERECVCESKKSVNRKVKFYDSQKGSKHDTDVYNGDNQVIFNILMIDPNHIYNTIIRITRN